MIEVINHAQLEWQGPLWAAPLSVRSQVQDIAREMSQDSATPVQSITVQVWS